MVPVAPVEETQSMRYAETGRPPSLRGGDQETSTTPSPRVALMATGAVGIVPGR